ncbi:linoleate diol synthase [Phlyctema vagabunda]|uniref:Linoleate diol synthase n=1 Tax=Phlyctema vagabunda TaxID=108571 RepID=A0ABR4P8I7_9HELO
MSFEALKAVVETALKPLPKSIDGRYDAEAVPEVVKTGLVKDLISQVKRLPEDAQVLEQFLKTLLAGGLIDDKTYFTEHIIQLAASLPPNSTRANRITGALIGKLWGVMQHPPLSYLGEEYKYRKADGSCNSIMYPNLGKSGSSYARTVSPQVKKAGALPDPGVVFDALLARNDQYREHPTKVSSNLFYFATIIIHDLFETSHSDSTKSNSSSYLDLGPLYGNNEAEQMKVRTREGGRLKPDTFSTWRILGFPPGVAALLICFNRFHNYIVEELATINEAGRFTTPVLNKSLDPKIAEEQLKKAKEKLDNDLFQTGRLITCGLYVNIILIDYVRTILNLNRSTSTWALDPRGTFDTIFNEEGTPSGIGNQVSAEFNFIYRWHATISKKDEKWTNDFFKALFPKHPDPSNMSVEEMYAGLKQWGHKLDLDPSKWTFDNLKRKENGSFDDAELNKIVTESTEDIAGAFGARNTPNIMKVIERLGIQQGRDWNMASLNEFRKFFKLKPHAKFTDINPDPDVAKSLEVLYDHPDFVELYPGLMAESAKEPMAPGSGLCPGFTISQTILSDAVTLVRGDRFYTVDYTPANLTAWGFSEVASDTKIAGGGVMYKLLMRAFPGFYKGNSTYALFPFTQPAESKIVHATLGTVDLYDYSAPSFTPQPTPVLTHAACVQILDDQARFKVPWGPNTFTLTKHDYMLSGDKLSNTDQREFVKKQLYCPQTGPENIRKFYEKITMSLLRSNSYQLRNVYQVDAVRDVGNPSHANFVAGLFHIPIKTPESPLGLFTAQELYLIHALVFAYVFLDSDPATSFALKTGAQEALEPLSKALTAVVEGVHASSILNPLKNILNMYDTGFVHDYGTNLIKRLSEGDKSVDEVVWSIIPTAAAAVATQGQGFAQMMELYLSDKYKHHWPAIQKVAQSNSPADFEKLRKYALEGYRLATPAFGLVRVAAVDGIEIKDGKKTAKFNKGDHAFTDFVTACVDPAVFPDPYQVKLDRPEELYIHHGHGPHSCLGKPMVVIAMAAQLRMFARLKNLRRAPGLQGEMKSKTVNGAFKVYMKEDWSAWWPFPTTMKVQFDGFEDGFLD